MKIIYIYSIYRIIGINSTPAFFTKQTTGVCIIRTFTIFISPAIIFFSNLIAIQGITLPGSLLFIIFIITFFFIASFTTQIVKMNHPGPLFPAFQVYPVQRIAFYTNSISFPLAITSYRNKKNKKKNESHCLVSLCTIITLKLIVYVPKIKAFFLPSFFCGRHFNNIWAVFFYTSSRKIKRIAEMKNH